MKAKFFFICLLILSAWSVGLSQENNLSTFIASSRKEKTIAEMENITAAIESSKFHVPILKEVQLRLGINGSALNDTIYGYLRNEDVYGLQIATNSLKEIKAQKNYKSALAKVSRFNTATTQHSVIAEKYNLATQLINLNRTKEILDSLLKLYEQKKNAQTSAIKSFENIKLNDVIDTDDNILKLQFKLQKLSEDIHAVNAKTKDQNGTSLAIEPTQLISNSELLQVVENISLPQTVHPSILEKEADVFIAKTELALAEADNRQIFNMFRMGYDYPLYLVRPKNFNTFNNFSVRLGLNVPLTGNNNFKQSKSKINIIEAEVEKNQLNDKLSKERLEVISKIKTMYNHMERYDQTLQKSLTYSLLNDTRYASTLSKIDHLDLLINKHKYRLERVEIENNLWISYVKLLEISAVISQEPLKNYLFNGVPFIR
jgi:hypothetical protein